MLIVEVCLVYGKACACVDVVFGCKFSFGLCFSCSCTFYVNVLSTKGERMFRVLSMFS